MRSKKDIAEYQKRYKEKNLEKIREYKKLWRREDRAKKRVVEFGVKPSLKVKKEYVSVRIIPRNKCQRCEILLKSKYAGTPKDGLCEPCNLEVPDTGVS